MTSYQKITSKAVLYPIGVSMQVEDGPKVYGWVNHATKPYVRKYKNPIKNGLSFLDLFRDKILKSEQELTKNLSTPLYGDKNEQL